MPFRVITPADQVRSFKVVTPARKPTAADDVGGALETVYQSIPFLNDVRDNVGAYVKTVSDLAVGKSSFERPKTWGEAVQRAPEAFGAVATDFSRNRAAAQQRRRASVQDFADRRPYTANLATGVGYAAQAVPALISGGGTVTPTVAAKVAPRGLMGASARALKPIADASVSAGLGAQIAGYGSDGTLAERQQRANETTLPAMAIGGALPVAGRLASKGRRVFTDLATAGGRSATRLTNRVAESRGAGFLDPRQAALKRLAEAMKADGLGPAEVRAGLEAWQATGASSPALMDLAGENTRALLRSAASKPGPARNTAVRYVDRVTADLQDNAINRTRALVDDPRTMAQVDDDISNRLTSATRPPEPQYGSAGAAVQERLNAGYDVGNRAVNDAYDLARGAAPEGAHLRSSDFPTLRANIREAVRDFHPEDAQSVYRELGGLDTMSTPTIRDLFETRQRLTAIRLSKPDQARAASQAINALDLEIDDAVSRGAVTGDPDVVAAWRQAIGERRRFGQDWEGGDLINRMTERTYRGGERTNRLATEDASALMFGRGAGVTVRPDMARDLVRLRDRLGADSAEWRAVQEEGVSRILGRDAGRETFGASWDEFSARNPEVAALLMSPEQQAMLTGARAQVRNALDDRAAVDAGRSVLTSSPDRLAADLPEGREGLARLAAAREIEDRIGAPAEGSTGLLNRLATGTKPGRNLAELYGEDQASTYQAAIRNEIERLQNARFISPNDGSQSAPRLMDGLLDGGPALSKRGIAMALLDKLRRGLTLSESERQALLEIGTTIVRSGADLPTMPTTPQAMRLLTPAQRARISRVLAASEGEYMALNATTEPTE